MAGSLLRKISLVPILAAACNTVSFSAFSQEFAERDKSAVSPPSGRGLGNTVIGGIPVNLFTGTASPTIPVYEVPGRSLTIPISLYYTAGNGVQVTSVASEVGTGWALSAGGRIQCEVRGRPDEADTDQKAWVAGVLDQTSGTYAAPFLCQGKDAEYDIYHISALGLQADFVINSPTDIRVLNNPTITVSPSFYFNSRQIYSFTVTDANGTRYVFSQPENTRIQTQTKKLSNNTLSGKDEYSYTSAWNLSSVQDARGDIASFYYQSDNYSSTTYKSYAGLAYAAYVKCNAQEQNCQTAYAVETRHETTTTIQVLRYNISSITTASCNVYFERTRYARRDAPGEKALDKIAIYDRNLRLVKSFHLNYSFFGPNNTTSPDAVRLRLDRVLSKGSGCVAISTSFQYREYGPTVSRNATNRDYWGYFNDNTTGDLLAPVEARFPSGNRTPSTGVTAQNCILYKIVQGTGAYTELTYGPQIDGNGTRVGGVRVEQVRVHDGQNSTRDQVFGINYNTFQPATNTYTSSSSAPIVRVPQMHDWQKLRYPERYYISPHSQSPITLNVCDSGDDLIDKHLYRSSEPVEPIAPDYIHYKWVSIVHPNGTKSAYRFTTSDDFPDTYNSQSTKVTADPHNTNTGCYNGSSLPDARAGNCNGDPLAPRRAGNYLPLPQDQRPYGILNSAAYKRGYVIQQFDLNSGGQTVGEVTNTFNFYNTDASPLRSAVVARERYRFGLNAFTYYYNVKVYKLERDWIPLTSQTVTRYDQRRGNTGAIAGQTQLINYYYRNNLLWKIESSRGNDDLINVVEYTRLRDTNRPPALTNSVAYATVLQKLQYQTSKSNSALTLYSTFTNNEFQANSNDFVWLSRTGTFFPDAGGSQWEYQVQDVEMNANGDAVNVLSASGLWSATLLGYNSLLPVATVTNGKFQNGSEASTAGHTSFEEDDNPDQWSTASEYSNEAKTGVRSVKLSSQYPYGPSKRFLLTPAQQKGKYKFTCWAKSPIGAGQANLVVVVGLQDANNNWLRSSTTNADAWYGVGYTVNNQQKWQLYTATVDFDDPAVRAAIPAGQNVRVLCGAWMPWGSEPVLVDEQRFHHENARMTTTTHQPLVGKTSETDANNKTTYYLYDSENQLSLVKDAEGNILKRVKTNTLAASREIDASVSRTSGNAYPGENLTFTAVAEACDGNLTYFWNFGDGATTKGASVQTHAYAQPGTYQLKIVVEAPGMNPQEKTLAITVTPSISVTPSHDGSTFMDLCNPSGDGSNGQRDVSVTLYPQDGCSGYLFRWETNEYTQWNNSWSGWTDANNTSPTFSYYHGSVRQLQVRCTITDACGNSYLYEDWFNTYSSNPNCETVIYKSVQK